MTYNIRIVYDGGWDETVPADATCVVRWLRCEGYEIDQCHAVGEDYSAAELFDAVISSHRMSAWVRTEPGRRFATRTTTTAGRRSTT